MSAVSNRPKMGRLCTSTIAISACAPLFSRRFALKPFRASQMSLSTYTKDGILTVVFDDARILDETKLENLAAN